MKKESYILYDFAGYPFNGKYPPCSKKSLYHGYETAAQECLFYDFAVLGYDLKIKYNGLYYYFMVDEDSVWLTDETFCEQRQQFQSGNDVLESFMIDGKRLKDVIDELEEFEPM